MQAKSASFDSQLDKAMIVINLREHREQFLVQKWEEDVSQLEAVVGTLFSAGAPVLPEVVCDSINAVQDAGVR